MKYILTIDAGTTSVRAILFDKEKGNIFKVEKEPFKQYFPRQAWVEHDANEIWQKIKKCILKVCDGVDTAEIFGVGISNQRETTVAWDKTTGEPLAKAIVWQCRRTSKICEGLKNSSKCNAIHKKTGLIPDAYFSATKMRWLIENNQEVKNALEEERLCFGTVESFLVFKLTNGKSFVTDVTNASRTMLFNILTLDWDNDLMKLFGIPFSTLPKVVSNDEIVGETDILGKPIKVAGLIGDQQSSLFGQGCFEKGMAKNTYGTGCFMLLNTGDMPIWSKNGLLTTVAFKVKNKVCYALEGSVFNAGSVVDWAVQNLGIATDANELTDLATSLTDNENVYLIPAFTGLGTPYWDMDARGMITGITRATDKRHIARAVLESMAFSTFNVLNAMKKEVKTEIKELHVDGGGSQNDFLMQFQCDLLQTKLKKYNLESTCMGIIFMTGLATGAYKNISELKKEVVSKRNFMPERTEKEMATFISGWHNALKRSLTKHNFDK
ncbi:MAG: glycerol kinase [Clostridia bacterium]|nr:glycerol kinase [Clostridia bacterium]